MAFRVPEWLGGRRDLPAAERGEVQPRPAARQVAGEFAPQKSEAAEFRVAKHLEQRGLTGFERVEPYPGRMSPAARQLADSLKSATAQAIASRPHLTGAFSVVDEVLQFHFKNNKLPGDGETPPAFSALRDELSLQVGIGVNAGFRDYDAARQTLKKLDAGAELTPAEHKDVADVRRVWQNEKRRALLPFLKHGDPFWTLNGRQRALLALAWLDVPWGSGKFALAGAG